MGFHNASDFSLSGWDSFKDLHLALSVNNYQSIDHGTSVRIPAATKEISSNYIPTNIENALQII